MTPDNRSTDREPTPGSGPAEHPPHDPSEVMDPAPGSVLPAGPYDPGVDAAEVSKAALTRFLPTSLVSMTSVLAVVGALGSVPPLDLVGGILGICALLSGGYWVGLAGLRRWLYPDAEVTGRRSFVAGLMSPLAYFGLIFLGAGTGPVEGLSLMFLSGVVMALLMFFAWLSPTPAHLLDDKYVLGTAESDAEEDGPR